jgi:predicted dehydrogenase
LETKRIRTAVVGCGKIGTVHADALSSLVQSELVAVCDASPDRAESFGERYSVPAYSDLIEMVVQAKVEAVAVCTPHPVHADAVEVLAPRGVHCLVEKPLAIDLAGCDRIIETCRRAGAKLGVMSQRRWYPPHVRMRRAIDAGAIGRPVLAIVSVLGWRDEAYYAADPWRGRWATEGGGVLVNQAPHQLDLLQWFMGPIDELYAYWANVNHPSIEVEDTAVAVVRFRSGALGNIVASNSQKPGLHWRIEVHGSNGASIGARTEGASMRGSGADDPAINDVWTVPGEEGLLTGWQAEDRATARTGTPEQLYHARQVEDFLDAVAADRDPAVSGEDARRVVEIFTAIYRSQRDRRPVQFPLKPETGPGFYGHRAQPKTSN